MRLEPTAEDPPPPPGAAAPPAFYGLLVLLLLLQHLGAWLGDAGLEHFEEVSWRIASFDGGQGWVPSESEATGGGPLFALIWWLARAVGLPWWGAQAVHAGLELLALLAWLRLAPRTLPSPVVWAAALWIALEPVPKLYLMENSTLVAIVGPALLAATLDVAQRGARSSLVFAIGLFGLALHFSMIAAPLGLLLAIAIVRGPARRAAGWLAALVVVAVGVLVPGFEAIPEPLTWLGSPTEPGTLEGAAAGPGGPWPSLGRWAFGLAVPVAVVGLAVGRLRGEVAPWWLGYGAAWVGLTALPMAFLAGTDGDPFHFSAATAGLALLAGAGTVSLGRAVAEGWRRSGRTPPSASAALTGLLSLACVLSAAVALTRIGGPGPGWRGEPGPYHCAASDVGVCDARALRSLRSDLADAGLTPQERPDVVFVGSASRCLRPSWIWDRGSGFGSDAATIVVLLDDDAAAEVPGARRVGGLVAIDGAVELSPEAWSAPVTEQSWVYLELQGAYGLEDEAVELPGGAAILHMGACPELVHRSSYRSRDGGAWLLLELRPGDSAEAHVPASITHKARAWLLSPR